MINQLMAHLRTDLLLVGVRISIKEMGTKDVVQPAIVLNLNSGVRKTLFCLGVPEGSSIQIYRAEGLVLEGHDGVFTLGDLFPAIDHPSVESYALLFESGCMQCGRQVEMGVTADGESYVMLIDDEA